MDVIRVRQRLEIRVLIDHQTFLDVVSERTLVCPQVLSLCLCLHLLSVRSFVSTVFLDTIYVCINIWHSFFSFWLTSLCITVFRSIHVSRSIHIPTNATCFSASGQVNIPGFGEQLLWPLIHTLLPSSFNCYIDSYFCSKPPCLEHIERFLFSWENSHQYKSQCHKRTLTFDWTIDLWKVLKF